jgi:hypothetical protein
VIPLTAAELAATLLRHKARTDALRSHGWGRPTTPYDRAALYDFTLDRGLLKANGHPKYKEPK